MSVDKGVSSKGHGAHEARLARAAADGGWADGRAGEAEVGCVAREENRMKLP